MNKSKQILIFDDVFHQGFTLGRIIDLLRKFNFKNFKLSTIARTVPKTLVQTFSFP
jgi:predicted amidophosphoribosyltransferase